MTNTLEGITKGAIFLGPKSNLKVTYNLFSLHSVKKTTNSKFTKVTTPIIVMKQVVTMALAKKTEQRTDF